MPIYDLTDHGSMSVEGEDEISKKKRLNNDELQENKDLGNLPSYSDVMSPSQYPRVSTVPITSANESDEEAIDIRIDEDMTTMQANDRASSSKWQERESLEEDRIWFTPAKSVETITSGSQCAWQVRFDAIEQTKGVPHRSSTLPLMDSANSNTSSSTGELPLKSSQKSHNSLTQEDLVEALPHSSAIFHPETLQWQVVLDSKEFSRGFKHDAALKSDVASKEDDLLLWQYIDTKEFESIKDGLQILSIPPIEQNISQAAWTMVNTFHCWHSTHGDYIYSTIPGSLQTVVPKHFLRSFKDERLSNPRPGISGILQFQDSAMTLIKIVGNAANGEGRALMLSGISISTKLGMDRHSEGILTAMGFTQAEQSDEQGGLPKKVIRPPDVSSRIFQLRLRRAWIELVLWYSYEARMLSTAEVGEIIVKCDVPFYPRNKSCVEHLSSLFGLQESLIQSSSKESIPQDLSFQLGALGIDENASDEQVDRCYKLNTAEASFFKRTHAFTALSDLVEKCRSDSEILQTLVAMERSENMITKQELIDAFLKIIGERLAFIEDSMQIDETFILDMYNTAVQDVASEPSKVESFKEALSIISLSRGRPSSIETVLHQPVELSLKKAYEMLDVTAETDDDFISSVYSLAAVENKFTEAQCIEALRIISKHRKSAVLSRLYRSVTGEDGILDWELADSEKPAGLNNIGNTCYLNSVLQYFYAIKPIRERVLEAGSVSDETKLNTSGLHFQIGGRKITQREFNRSHRFVKLLSQLFSAMMTSPISAVTPERELAYLALVSSEREESLGEMEGFNDKGTEPKALDASHNSAGTDTTLVEEPKSYISEVNPQVGPSETIDPSKVIQNTETQAPSLPARPHEQVENGQRRNSLMQLGAQQDVSECLDNVMFQVESALTAQAVAEDKSQKVEMPQSKTILLNDGEEEWIVDGDLLRRLFLGRTTQRLELEKESGDQKSIRSGTVHTKREVFKILPIVVEEEGRDIYDGLDGFFAEETLTHESGRPMNRTVSLIDAPAILQIQLQRVQYDRKRNTTFKSQAHLSVNETIFMDRYLDFDPTKAEDRIRIEKRKKERLARQEIAELRTRIRLLKSSEDGKKPIARSLERSGSLLSILQNAKSPMLSTADEDQGTPLESKTFGIPSDLFEDGFTTFLEQESKRVEEEIKKAEEQIVTLKMHVESLWEDELRIEYVLSSVFMHRGEASHGHYFLNQRRLGSKNVDENETEGSTWFKYNDNVVQEIPLTDVMKDKTGATPYLLSFVRKDMQQNHETCLFETVCRQVDNEFEAKSNEDLPPKQNIESNLHDVDMKENINIYGKETESSAIGDAMDTET